MKMNSTPISTVQIMNLKDSRKSLNIVVESKDLKYSYGSGKGQVEALTGVSVSVPAGRIYGLLGPSGCGKTTFLKCVVGRLKKKTGTLKVFGRTPGINNFLVPGPGVGYMPQELDLFQGFTMKETLIYFGQICRMNIAAIEKRIEYLVKLFDLPSASRTIASLSGGQKRRVSLAVSMVHSPPLLILDEPTVGVDPVLRQSIWQHLVKLTQNSQLTVIITTHYIEEARSADICSFMRNGHIMVEGAPEFLLKRFGKTNLESVFLQLCSIDDCISDTYINNNDQHIEKLPDIDGVNNTSPSNEIATIKVADQNHNILTPINGQIETELHHSISVFKNNQENLMNNFDTKSMWSIRSKRTAAHLVKNITRLRRNLPVLLFQFILPSLVIILFCSCIGKDPKNIKTAYYNREVSGLLGIRFLNSINKESVKLIPYSSGKSARQAVVDGEAWAAVVIEQNFSNSLLRSDSDFEEEGALRNSKINLFFDFTNPVMVYNLMLNMILGFRDMSASLNLDPEHDRFLSKIPFQIQDPVYGTTRPTFTEFMAPAVLLSIPFLVAVASTALAFVQERKEGLERTLIAGVSSFEIVFSQIMTQILLLAIQVTLLLIFTFAVFRINCVGPIYLVASLTFLQGVCGMTYGLMISSICQEENSATMLASGSFYPNLLLSGVVWPSQAMPQYIMYFSYLLPQTLPIEAMRYILSRGWDLSYYDVSIGFLVTIIWILIFIIATSIIFRRNKGKRNM